MLRTGPGKRGPHHRPRPRLTPSARPGHLDWLCPSTHRRVPRPPPHAAPAALDAAGRRRVTAVLCLTEVTSWGVLFYAFPVLQQDIAADTGWATVHVAAAFTLGQVIAAVAGIGVGRVLDRRGPRWLMTGGSVLAVASLLMVASATSLAVFLAGWVLAGLAMSAVLYPPAFAALTRWHDHGDRLRALTVLTVAGGLASTVFAPLTAALAGALDWRDTYLVLAAVLALVTIPLHAWGLRGPWPAVAEHAVVPSDVTPWRSTCLGRPKVGARDCGPPR